jgi:uncharacterized membrane protein YdbT with pleckstrin-like domain
VAFPDDQLTADEHVVLHLRPHWRVLIGRLCLTLLAVGVILAVALWTGNQLAVGIGVIAALLVVIWLAVWPWFEWRSTHYVFTNERVMLRSGIATRDRRDIPLNRINDHSTSQTVVDRMFGCGTMTIESASERGQSVLRSVPGIDRVQTVLNEITDRAVAGPAQHRIEAPTPQARRVDKPS